MFDSNSKHPRRMARTILFAVLMVTACEQGNSERKSGEPDTLTYEVRGRFLNTSADGLRARIHHEEIASVMPIMKMWFIVKEQDALRDIPEGSAIAFTLVRAPGEDFIENIRLLPPGTMLSFDEQ